MAKLRAWLAFLLAGGLCIFTGRSLHGGGEEEPTLSVVDLNQVRIHVVTLSDTDVEIGEDVHFEVKLQNRYDSPVDVDLWFTVDLTGVEPEKRVSNPYLNRTSPIHGTLPANEEVVLQFSARPLENIPTGPYIFYTKTGMYDTDFVKSIDRFEGTILHHRARNNSSEQSEDWIISAIWAVNEAGRAFLEGNGRMIPRTVAMLQNYPNPFNPSTNVTYEVRPAEGLSVPVNLSVYDVRGRLVRTLVDGHQAAGLYTAQWNGRDSRGESAESGIYFFRLQTGDVSVVRKAVMTK